MNETNSPILFYDGDCGFCNRSVEFVLKRDRSRTIHFAALQSEFAQAFFEQRGAQKPDLSTLYFFHNEQFHAKSGGALRLIAFFAWYYQPLRALWIIPSVIRDAVYNQVAKRRTRIAKGYCVQPSLEDASRFLGS